MKVVFASNIPNPYNGSLYEQMRHLGADVVSIFEREPRAEGRSWSITLGPGDYVARSAAHATELLQRHIDGADAVVLSGRYLGLVPTAWRALAGRKAPPTYYWGERLRPHGRAVRYWRRAYFSGLTGVLAVGSWAASSYEAACRGSTPVHVFPYVTYDRSSIVTSFAQPYHVGFVGSLIHRKGCDELIQGASFLEPDLDVTIEVAGDGELRSDLASLAESLSVRVNWLGNLAQEELDVVRQRWRIQVVPSRYDGWGMVVPEALGMGLPVVASDKAGAAIDLIRDNVNGAIAVGPVEIARAIRRYEDIRCADDHGAVARVVGRLASAKHAAPWLLNLLSNPGDAPRSYVDWIWQQDPATLASSPRES